MTNGSIDGEFIIQSVKLTEEQFNWYCKACYEEGYPFEIANKSKKERHEARRIICKIEGVSTVIPEIPESIFEGNFLGDF